MIHIAKIDWDPRKPKSEKNQGVVCEVCGREVRAICFWFTRDANDIEDDGEVYLEYVQGGKLERFEDVHGELVTGKMPANNFPELSGKRIGYAYHEDPSKKGNWKNRTCKASRKAPAEKNVLENLVERVKEEIKNPSEKRTFQLKNQGKNTKFRGTKPECAGNGTHHFKKRKELTFAELHKIAQQ